MAFVINHRLGLALRLVDTTTGRAIADRALALRRDGKEIHPMVKGDGVLVLLDQERADFDLEVSVPGYEGRQLRVSYAQLDPGLPRLDLHLIPGPDYRSRYPCLTLEGELPGITGVDAVKAGESPCLIREFDPRKKLLTVFNPHKLELDRVWYALVDPDQETYEVFSVVRRVSDQVYKLDRALETPFKNYFPICPLVFGGIGPGDRYRLRVRDDGTQARWMVRLQREGGQEFRIQDFRGAPESG